MKYFSIYAQYAIKFFTNARNLIEILGSVLRSLKIRSSDFLYTELQSPRVIFDILTRSGVNNLTLRVKPQHGAEN